MSFPPVTSLLRHRPPALAVERVEEHAEDRLVCSSVPARRWWWFELLDGAAQAAGLLLRGSTGRPLSAVVVAAYDELDLNVQSHEGPVRWEARRKRRVGEMHQFEVSALAEDGHKLLSALVTLVPVAGG